MAIAHGYGMDMGKGAIENKHNGEHRLVQVNLRRRCDRRVFVHLSEYNACKWQVGRKVFPHRAMSYRQSWLDIIIDTRANAS